jgi:multidrug efflux pump subunit AcrB
LTNPSLRQRFNISRLAIRYSRLTLAFWIAMTVAGLLAFSSLKYALFPDIAFPVVVVKAQAPLETLTETEAQLAKPLEAPLISLPDSYQIYSQTYAGRNATSVSFNAGIDLETATKRVKAALQGISLPAGAQFEVVPLDLNESPVISYALTSESQSLAALAEIAREKIVPEIRQLSGIRKVNLLGDVSESQLQDSAEETFPTRVNFNGKAALGLQAIKRGDANTLEVVKKVEKEIGKLRQQFPELQIILAETQAHYIRSAINETVRELILAVILATAVVFPFLRDWRATAITALAIPLSLLATCIVMAIAGLTLEIITLLALALVIGTVIDDAIVDVENIARLVDAGKPPKEAAIAGTDEIGMAVTASSLAIAAAFLPVIFMKDTVGRFFQPFGLTVSAAVLFSLLVARTLSPVMAAYWLKPRKNRKAGENWENSPIIRHYRQLLRWSLCHRRIVMGLALVSFAAGVALIPLIPQGFIPKLDRGEFIVSYTAPLPKIGNFEAGKSLEPTPPTADSAPGGGFDWIAELSRSPERLLLRKAIKVGKQLEGSILAFPDVQSTFAIAGSQGDPTQGQLFVKLKDKRTSTTTEVQEQVRRELPSLKGVTASVEDVPFVQAQAEKNLQVALLSQDRDRLRQAARRLQAKVEELPGLADVGLSESGGKIERLDGQYATYLNANLQRGRGLEDAALEIERLAQPLLPAGVTLQRAGTAAQSSDVLDSFGGTIVLSVGLMLLVLVLLFRSLLEPLVIGLSLPLSLVGVMLGLLLTGSEFGIASLIGFLFLVGLLAKNGLLLLDYAKQLRQRGFSREEALIETGAVRLRPIVMTTGSAILGMLPIALGWGAGAELRQPMAVAILGGLTTSSLLSLIVVPVLYTLLEDAWQRLRN